MSQELNDFLKSVLVTNPELVDTRFGNKIDNFVHMTKRADNAKELTKLAENLVRPLTLKKSSTSNEPVIVSAAEKGAFAAKLLKLLPTYSSSSFTGSNSSSRAAKMAGLRHIIHYGNFTEVLELYFSKGYIWDNDYAGNFHILMTPDRVKDLRLWIKAAKPFKTLSKGKTLAELIISATTPHALNLLEFGAPENWPESIKQIVANDLDGIYKKTIKDTAPTDAGLQSVIDVCLPFASDQAKENLAKASFYNSDLITSAKPGIKFTIDDLSKLDAGTWGDAEARFVELIDFICSNMPELPFSDAGKSLLSKAIKVGYEPALKLINMGVFKTDEWSDTFSVILDSEGMSITQKEALMDVLIEKNVRLRAYDSHVPAATQYSDLKGSNMDFTDKLLKLGLGEDYQKGYDSIFIAAVRSESPMVERSKNVVSDKVYVDLGFSSSDLELSKYTEQFPEKSPLILAGAAFKHLTPPASTITGAERSTYWDKAVDKVMELKTQGADLDKAVLLGKDIIHRASAAPKKQFIRLLKQGGFSPAAIDKPDTSGNSIIHRVAGNGEVQSLQTLLALGGDIEKRDSLGRTALFLAVSSQHSPTTMCLDKAGADFKTMNDKGDGLLSAVLMNNRETNRDLLCFILDKRVSVASTDKPILEKLMDSQRCTPDMLEAALQMGANPNDVCKDGEPVVFCNLLRSPNYLTHMVNYGLDIFAQDSAGTSVLNSVDISEAKKLVQLATDRAKGDLKLQNDTEQTIEVLVDLG